MAICGRVLGVTMVAMILPPKAGRVWSRFFVSGSIASSVQSAVRPALVATATREMRLRPMVVAPQRKILGLVGLIMRLSDSRRANFMVVLMSIWFLKTQF